MLMVVKKLGGRTDCPKCQRRVLEIGDRYVCTGRSGCARGPVPTSGTYEECASGERHARALALLDRVGDAAADALIAGEAHVIPLVWLTPLETVVPQGNTMHAMREHVRTTDLYRKGDTVLVWVNEGDLLLHQTIIAGRLDREGGR